MVCKRQNSDEDEAWRSLVGYASGKHPSNEEWPKLSGTRVTRIAAELTTLVRV